MCVTQDENLAWTVNDTLDLVADLSPNAISSNQWQPNFKAPKLVKELPKILQRKPKEFSEVLFQEQTAGPELEKTNCEEERRPRHWIRVWCALLKRSTEIFLNSNRKSLHKLNFSHHDWFGEMNTHKTMALEEVLDGVLPLLWSKRSFCSLMLSFLRVFRYLAQEDLLRKYLH